MERSEVLLSRRGDSPRVCRTEQDRDRLTHSACRVVELTSRLSRQSKKSLSRRLAASKVWTFVSHDQRSRLLGMRRLDAAFIGAGLTAPQTRTEKFATFLKHTF